MTIAPPSSKPIALVSMPTLSVDVPSFQLGLLKPTLERAGFTVHPFSLYVYFAAHIGLELNEELAKVWPSLIGEWIWARAAFGDFADADAYIERFRPNLEDVCEASGASIEEIRAVRDELVPAFLEFCVSRIDWGRFGLIGFTVVFQQMLASIALAGALKKQYPEIPIAFGGATFEDDIAEEIIKNCACIDYVHCGDADDSLPEMVRRIYTGESLAGLGGPMFRGDHGISFAGRAPNLADLDKTPIPDFDEYFYARDQVGLGRDGEPHDVLLPIETARGCWWGMKNHCTFCGLNRAGMEFRAKRPEAVLEMLGELSRKYGQFSFNAIDNILAPEYVEGLFGRLAEARSDMRIHYEIRPSVSRAQLKKMRLGGLYSVQPGVESFSTNVLTLMKKHTTGMRNVELLKWCAYYGINNLYNLLWGFAGETAEDYSLQVGLIPLLRHLQPPYAVAQARPDRGSPMHTNPERLSIVKLRHAACYRYLYPDERFRLDRVSYFFEHETRNLAPTVVYDALHTAVHDWQQSWQGDARPSLRYRKSWDSLVIEDLRNGAPRILTFEDREARLLEICADAKRLREIKEVLADDSHWVEDALDRLQQDGIVLALDDRYLTLALPENPYW
jgi:ribosomal peptide maturation radical SAM protein 1